jgi:hypothetical protein
VPSKTALLRQYDELEDRIEGAAFDATWELADWLAETVKDGRQQNGAQGRIALSDLAERRGRGLRWLQRMRQVAALTATDRLPDVSLRVYQKALEDAGNDLAKANSALRRKGTRLRDHAGPMGSLASIRSELAKRPPAERASLTVELLNDDDVVDHVVASSPGAAVVERASHAARRYEAPHDGLVSSPLPRVPAFTPKFWAAVQAVRVAHEVLTNQGLGEHDIDAETHQAAERLQREAGEIAAAVAEAVIEQAL